MPLLVTKVIASPWWETAGESVIPQNRVLILAVLSLRQRGDVDFSLDAQTIRRGVKRALLSRVPIDLARHLHAAQPIHIFRDAPVEGLGDALAVFAGFEPVLVRGIADE